MSLEKLREAIEKVDYEIKEGNVIFYNVGEHPAFYAKDLIPIIAAARAYSCKLCEGSGIDFSESVTVNSLPCNYDHKCQNCAKWRRIADE